MLKIKDNVDLKELEKFGFKLSQSDIFTLKKFDADYSDEGGFHEILIYIKSRGIKLDIMNNDYTYHCFDNELGGIEKLCGFYFDTTCKRFLNHEGECHRYGWEQNFKQQALTEIDDKEMLDELPF